VRTLSAAVRVFVLQTLIAFARDDIPKITKYPDGQTAPTPSAIDFKPGELLGSVSGELGLRKFLEKAGHTLVVTSSKDGKAVCNGPLIAREGQFVLKYFLLREATRLDAFRN
jgi:hypothetical protein